MVIMIIFLVLTVLFIIGTVIYLNNKKKNVNAPKHSAETKDKDKSNKKGKKQLTDILQIKIKDNIICLGNRYSNVIKLGNIDYNMLSNSEQDSIENVLIQTALAIDYPIQFFSTTEFIDTSKVISLIKQNKTNNTKIREYKEYLIDYLQNLMENRTISVVKNYAIISYDGTYEKAIEELQNKLETTDFTEELKFTPRDILLKRDIDFINKIKLNKEYQERTKTWKDYTREEQADLLMRYVEDIELDIIGTVIAVKQINFRESICKSRVI